MALRLRVHVPGTRLAHLPDLRCAAADGALLPLRRDENPAAAMILTRRCRDLLRLLRTARWLSTSQIHRRFFSSATTDAARKRLRILAAARYLASYRPHRMAEALYTLGPDGKRALEREGFAEIALERRPPKQLEHLLGVNDLRIAAEREAALTSFFAYWELPALRWRHPIIPDALLSAHGRTFVLEFDRGAESLRYFVATKIRQYERGFLPISTLVVICDREARMRALARAIGRTALPVLFTTLDLVRERGLGAAIFWRGLDEGGERLW
jgi:hypothetical protein